MTDPRTSDVETSAPTPGLLSRISTEVVQAIKRHYGKGPVSAKSYLVDDLLFVVLRGGITQAERTMLEAGRENLVRQFRQEFEHEIGGPLVGLVERLTGRRVISYQGQIVFDPDISIKIFVFEDRLGSDPASAAALRLLEPPRNDGRREDVIG